MHQIAKVPWQVIGINKGAFVALCALDDHVCSENTDMTASELAEVLGISKGGVSQILRSLERDGFVERHPQADDRRVVCVRPTADGLAVVRKAKDAYERMMGQVLVQMGEEDAAKLDCLLGRFCSILDTLVTEELREAGKAKEETCVDS